MSLNRSQHSKEGPFQPLSYIPEYVGSVFLHATERWVERPTLKNSVCVRENMCVHVYIHKYLHIEIHTHVCVCIYIYTHTCVYYIYIYMCVCVCVCVYLYMREREKERAVLGLRCISGSVCQT